VRGRNTTTPNTKIELFFVDAAFLAMTTFVVGANAQLNEREQLELTSPLEPLRSGITVIQIFDELLAHNALRSAMLLDYTALRTYQVVDGRGNLHAEEVGRIEYGVPGQKTFVVTSKRGSGLIRHWALNPLIAGEIEAAGVKEHDDGAISPANYTLWPLGEQQVGPY